MGRIYEQLNDYQLERCEVLTEVLLRILLGCDAVTFVE